MPITALDRTDYRILHQSCLGLFIDRGQRFLQKASPVAEIQEADFDRFLGKMLQQFTPPLTLARASNAQVNGSLRKS